MDGALRSKQSPIFFLLALYFSSLLIRLCFFYFVLDGGTYSFVVRDCEQYRDIAFALLQGDGFYDVAGDLYANRLPGYCLFLATLLKIFGGNLTAALVGHVVFISTLPLLVYGFSKTLFPTEELVARLSGIVATIACPFVLYSGIAFSEGLFVILFLIFLIFFIRGLYNASALIVAGCLLGLVSLVRPLGVFLLAYSVLVLLFKLVLQKRLLLEAVTKLILLSASWGVIVVGWLMRNYFLFGAFFFHTLPGVHFLQYSAVHVYAAQHVITPSAARTILFKEVKKVQDDQEKLLGRNLNEYEMCCVREKVAAAVLRSAPRELFYDCIRNWSRTLFGVHTSPLIFCIEGWPPPGIDYSSFFTTVSSYLNPSFQHISLRLLIYADFLFLLLLWLLVGAIGVAICKRLLPLLPVLAAGGLCCLFIFLTLSFGCARLRFPVEPIILVVGLYALVQLYRERKKQCR